MLFLLLILTESCDKNTQNKKILPKSGFNLERDIADFKNKMTESDTIKLWIDHSVCTYVAYERIIITKKSGLIKIQSEFNENTFKPERVWNIMYQKEISVSDTIWKIESLFKRNSHRLKLKGNKNYGTLQVSYKDTKLHYFTKGLVDLNKFLEDYYNTMRKLFPENKEYIYGYQFSDTLKIPEEIELEVIK